MKSKIISFFIITLFLTAIFVFFAYHTAGFKQDFKKFYVVCNGTVVTTCADGYNISDEPLNVEIRYVLKDDSSGYSVKVVPNKIEGKDFTFDVGGEQHAFFAETDLTKGFDIEYGEKTFTIKSKGGITDVLSMVYPGGDVKDCREKAYLNMYSLVISSKDNKASVTINFSVPEALYGVALDKGVIEF